MELKLPVLVSSLMDVGRLIRELDDIENVLHQLKLRHAGKEVKMPKTSLLMDQLSELNKLNLLHDKDRAVLKTFLETLRQRAPVLHISFSTDPSGAFIQKLTAWLRTEIHPTVLITVGLQPNIGVGCIVRSTNKYFDLSIRTKFLEKQDLLKAKLKAGPQEVKA